MKFHNYYIYIATNPTKSTLYTGVTNDLERRMEEHKSDAFGEKKTFAGKYCCFNLSYYEYFFQIEEAIDREKEIKLLKRKKKEELINFFNPHWRFLNAEREKLMGDLPVWNLEMEEKKPW